MLPSRAWEVYGGMARANPRRSNGSQRNKNRARMRAEGRECWICKAFGRPAAIDYSLPAGHPLSFELDELIPVSKYQLGNYSSPEQCALDYSNNAATHKCCNNWRKNKTVEEVLEIAAGVRRRKKETKPFVPHEIEQPVAF